MNRDEFLAALRGEIDSLDLHDRNRFLDYYREMIDDCIENGMPEADAVASMGDVRSIAERILSDIEPNADANINPNITPDLTPNADSDTDKNKQDPGEENTKKSSIGHDLMVALIVMTAVIWIPLIFAAAAVILAVYIVMWSVVLVAYSLSVAFIAATAATIHFAVTSAITGSLGITTISVGGAFICFGLSILCIILSIKLTKWTARLAVVFSKSLNRAFGKKTLNHNIIKTGVQ